MTALTRQKRLMRSLGFKAREGFKHSPVIWDHPTGAVVQISRDYCPSPAAVMQQALSTQGLLLLRETEAYVVAHLSTAKATWRCDLVMERRRA